MTAPNNIAHYPVAFIALFLSIIPSFLFAQVELLPSLPDAPIHKEILLIGNTGGAPDEQIGLALARPYMDASDDVLTLFLGDMIIPRGMEEKAERFEQGKRLQLDRQLDFAENYPDRVFFTPGDKDWDDGGRRGRKSVQRLEDYIQDRLDWDALIPDNACAGPEVEEQGLVNIIAIDTQWWLHRYERSIGQADGCDAVDELGFIDAVKAALKDSRNQHTLLIGHHPVMSFGHRGGRFPLSDHIFPLHHITDKGYVPLPLIGSLYPLYRSSIGERQDIQHPRYRDLSDHLIDAISDFGQVVYASAHEYNFQHIPLENNHLVISGASTKALHVSDHSRLAGASKKKGISRLIYFEDGSVWLEYIALEEAGPEVVYRSFLYQKDIIALDESIDVPEKSYAGKKATVWVDSTYHTKGIEQFFMGELNRPLWTTPIEVPYLDIHYEKGGLRPVKLGGGMQTKSLRLVGGDGHEYVLRKLQKSAEFLVEKGLRRTIVRKIIYDGIAGSHPYAAIVIPALSDTLGIYHTSPRLVYVPDDPILGDVRDEFGGTFCLFEIRPDDDMSDLDEFEDSDEIIGYTSVVEKVHDKRSHRVDEPFVLRNRLFDMLIGDWDRHDDQWRWIAFEEGDHTIYRPVPRDRDQAFFKFDGLLPNIANRKWLTRKFQDFSPEVRDIRGLNYNARHFDRAWLTSLERKDWKEQVRYIQSRLTDEVIDRAIDGFPPEALEFNGDHLKSTLKARRDNLMEIAMEYYDILAESVSITGKMKDDYFKLERVEGGLKVAIYPKKDDRPVWDEPMYERLFHADETKEVLLFGLDGDDTYHITGEVDKSVLVRIIGGEERDSVIDLSKDRGIRHMTRYYDDRDQNTVIHKGETRVEFKTAPNVVHYKRRAFRYDRYLPQPFVGINPDDGLLLGVGISWVREGFNKEPYKRKQRVKANGSFRTGAFNVEYFNHFVEVLGPFDLGLEVDIRQPFNFIYNGFGNDTERLRNSDTRVRLDMVSLNPFISLTNATGSSQFRVTGELSRYEFLRDEYEGPLEIPSVSDEFYGGGVEYRFENDDDRLIPSRGIHAFLGAQRLFNLDSDREFDHSKFQGQLVLYFPIGFVPGRATLALRSGGEYLDGDFPFYRSAFVGGQSEVRGMLRNRFAGRAAQYNNAELRVHLARANSVKPLTLGLFAHYDVGRVWVDDDMDSSWHNSIGGGLYLKILNYLTINSTYSVSDVDSVFQLRLGFFY
ncbi:MAG: BamA/TamA family outer membrane protein [Flavobacteriales bacterium]|nr:BamA/TamA family outer membrane protein [Flavobacteriales bacterium]